MRNLWKYNYERSVTQLLFFKAITPGKLRRKLRQSEKPTISMQCKLFQNLVFQSWMSQSTRSHQHLKYSGGWTITGIYVTCSFMRTGPVKSLTSPRDFLLVTSGQPQSLLVYSHRWLRTHTSRHRLPPASSEGSFSSQISQQFVPKSITNAVGTWRCVRERGSRPSG